MEQAQAAFFEATKTYLDYYEKWRSDSIASSEEIANIFDIAYFLERVCTVCKDNGSEAVFGRVLSDWCLFNKYKDYNILFFEKSCDHIVRKFMQSDSAYEMKTLAKQHYVNTVRCPERSTAFIEMITSEANIFADVIKMSNILQKYVPPEDNNAWHVLNKISILYQQGKLDELKELICHVITSHEPPPLETILRVLARHVGNNSQEIQDITQLVMTMILSLMCNNQSLVPQFWKLCCRTDQVIVGEVAQMYSKFLKSMTNFIIASVESKKLNKCVEQDKEHFLSNGEIKVLIKCLISAKGSAESVIKTILLEKTLKQRNDGNIWAELKNTFY